MSGHCVNRLRLLSYGVIIIALIFIVRLYFLQVVNYDEFVNNADKQYVKRKGSLFSRGSILFEDKDGKTVSAATLGVGYTLVLNPKLIEDPKVVFEKISKYVEVDPVVFNEKANKKDDPYEEILKRVPEEKAKLIQAEKIKGVSLVKEQWRVYPGGKSASHEIGLIAYKDDDLSGRYGLERQYDKVLKRDENNIYANFFIEIFSNIKKGISKDSSFEGDIVATIEPNTQVALEETLQGIHTKWSSAETGGLIIDPNTGEIIAMASFPNFDPNDFKGEKDVKVFSNPMVEEVREMGSIIKPLTVAAGLDAGVITANTSYLDKGFVTLNTETIYNHDKKGRGQITIQTALSNSLNTGMVHVMSRLGTKRFADYMYSFGLGEKTGIDLPNEAQNIVGNLKSPREIEYATASFGQGIALTPISTASALSVLANGGFRVTPHLVKRINYKAGLGNDISPGKGERVIKKETSDEITRMLVKVVDETLLNGKAKNDHYSIAAKTGTAQIAMQNGKGYYDDRYLHSFMGYFPAYKPKFLILLYTLYPKEVGYAADTLAMPFMDLSKFLISFYELPPDR